MLLNNRCNISAYFIITGIALLGSLSYSFAASCSGVAYRVNEKTNDLENSVIEKIKFVEKSIIDESINQTSQIISAIRVVNTSANSGADQNIAAMKSASEASASTWVAHRVNQLTLEATQKYRSIGYNACGSISAAHSFAQANSEIENNALKAQGKISSNRSYEVWFKNAATDGSGSVSASDILNGNIDKAYNYIEFVLGAEKKRDIATDNLTHSKIDLIEENRKTALKSLASFVMVNAAKYKETDKKLDAFTSSWMGKDGGEKWSASMAASHERGVLLDLVRVEAANIAAKSYGLKKHLNTELAIAGYALARTEAIIASETNSPSLILPAKVDKTSDDRSDTEEVGQ